MSNRMVWILVALLPLILAAGLFLRWWLHSLGVPSWAL